MQPEPISQNNTQHNYFHPEKSKEDQKKIEDT